MKNYLLLFCFLGCALKAQSQMVLTDQKGTKVAVDSSKWTLSGTNISNKNSGNVGIGNSAPAYKLDVTGKLRNTDSFITNSVRINGLISGNTGDSILSVDPATGVVKRIAFSRFNRPDSTTADNGLTLTGKNIQLGGALTAATSITTSTTNTLTLAGLSSGNAATDSLLTATAAGVIKRIAPAQLNKVDSTTASNGINLNGKDIRLGGNLTQATTVTSNGQTLSFATGGSALNISGLTSGSFADSFVVADATTGQLKRLTASRLNKNDSTTADNGLTLTNKNVQLGGNLTQATTVTSNSQTLTFATGGTALNVTGLASGSVADSFVVNDAASGQLRRVSAGRLNKNDSTTADNGLTLTGKNIQLGGTLTAPTTITTSATNTITLSGLGSGNASTDSILTATAAGVIKRIAPAQLNRLDSTTASNGLNLTGKDVRLGGNLTQATTLTSNGQTMTFATGGAALNVTGLNSGSVADSILVADASTGQMKRIAPTRLNKNDSTTADNGLTLTGKNVQLGGNLTQSTTVTSNSQTLTFATGGTAMNVTGLASGSTADSFVVADAGTGQLKRVSAARLNKNDSTTADNGLTLTGKNLQLGGTLTTPTTLTTSTTNTLTLAGLGSGNAATDSLLVATATGVVKRISSGGLTGKMDSTTASNGLTLTGKDVRLGGNLSAATTVTSNAQTLTFATGGTAMNVTGLVSGSVADSFVVADATTGQLKRVSSSRLNKNDSTTADNGLTLTGKNLQLGGSLTAATTITTSATNTLTLAGLTSGSAATDSILTATAAGVIKRISATQISTANRVDSTTASNGLTLTGKDVRLGGNLSAATTITNNAQTLTFATGGTALNVTGLVSGSVADSFVVADATTGQLKRVSSARISKNDSTTANNGLTLTGKNVQLGGALTQSTTITNSTFPLTVATGGTAFNITGLTSGAITTDSIVTLNISTGKLNRVAPGAIITAQNMKVTSGRINTIQNIDTASTPKFFNLSLSDFAATGLGGTIGAGGGAGVVVNDDNGLLGTQSGTGLLSDDGTGVISYIPTNSFVTSLSGGTTGLTPSGAATGSVTLAGVLVPANGGTGISTVPSTGTIAVGNGTNYTLLAAGASGTVLKGNGIGVAPSYSAVSLTTDVSGTLPVAKGGTNNTAAYTAGSIIFSDGTKLTQRNSNLFWDNTNFRLGIGKTAPARELDVAGDVQFSGALLVGPTGDAGAATYVLTSQGSGSAPKWALAPGASGSTVGNGPWLNAYTGLSATDTATKINFGGVGGVGIQNSSPTARLAVGTTFTDAYGGNVQINALNNTNSAASLNGYLQVYPRASGQTSRIMLPNIGYSGVNGKLVNNTSSSLELQNFTSPDAGVTQTPVSAISLGGTTTSNGTASLLINNTTQLTTNSDSTRVAGKLSLASDFRPGGNPGTSGYILMSQGAGVPPVWNSTTTPDATSSAKGAIQLAGDLNGNGTAAAAPRVSGLQGNAVSTTAPSTNQVLCWNATTTQWEPTALMSILTTTASQVDTSTTVYVNINTLQFDAAPGRTYRVKMWLLYNAAIATTGIRLGPNTFSGGNIWYQVMVNSSTTGAQQLSAYNTNTALISTASRATTNNIATIEATVQNTSASLSTLSFRFASEISGSAITVLPGSRLEYEIIN